MMKNSKFEKFNFHSFESLQAESFKFRKDPRFDESLQGNSKFVKIPPEMQNFYAAQGKEDSIAFNSLVETWKDNDFPSNANQSTAKKNKYLNKARLTDEPEGQVEEEPDLDLDRDSSDEEKPEKVFEKQKQWEDRHKELLNAKNILSKAMNEANQFAENEKNLDELATNTHQQRQLEKVGNINDELDEIEKMVKEQNDSNIRNNRVNQSNEDINISNEQIYQSHESLKKSYKNASPNQEQPRESHISKHTVESSRDPFDKLEEVGRSVSQQEIEEMRKTSKSQKFGKRKPWGKQKNKAVNRTDYNQDPQEDEVEPEYQSPAKISERTLRKHQESQGKHALHKITITLDQEEMPIVK